MKREVEYPQTESSKLKQISELMSEWKNSLSDNEKAIFVEDGFYPNYFSKKPKILFIGRESLEVSGENYIELLFDSYVNSKKVGSRHLNQNAFHRRLLFLAYGILNRKSTLSDYNAMPSADIIGDTFATENGVSFAFMNISKSSNDKTVQADWGLIEESISNGLQFIKKEIEILEPDVIITGNIGGYFFKIFKEIRVVDRLWSDLDKECDVCIHELSIGGKIIPLLDCWHFSNFKKRDFENFYEPICRYLKCNNDV